MKQFCFWPRVLTKIEWIKVFKSGEAAALIAPMSQLVAQFDSWFLVGNVHLLLEVVHHEADGHGGQAAANELLEQAGVCRDAHFKNVRVQYTLYYFDDVNT